MEEEFIGLEIEDHTAAKHQILTTYVNAWVPILSRASARRGETKNELVFVDGFAGPGICRNRRDGDVRDGSPILALKSVLDHSVELPIPVRFLFIEENKMFHSELENNISKLGKRIRQHPERISGVKIELGDCDTILRPALQSCFGKPVRRVGPALFFLDQFGYTDISMDLIREIMKYEQCEVFSYLNWQRMNNFMPDETKWQGISRAYGSDDWRKALSMHGPAKQRFMMDEYKQVLREKARVTYVWHFAMCDRNNRLIYWLFFCTNNIRGLEEMKRAMWKTDPSGGFRFSDRDDPNQTHLFKEDHYSLEMKSADIRRHFANHRITINDIYHFVLTETPHYKYKDALQFLERNNLLIPVNPPPKRRRFTFANEGMMVSIR